jgi:predicted Ser/Thr protein kinase/tetratricopeptide (TPR) repeat protein
MKKIGKYRILEILGKGGMGIVYKALDPDIEREVAIKTIRFDTLTDGTEKDDLMARFIREARAAGKLDHPNIITVYDVGREKDLTYIVMQYIEGRSLQAVIDSGKRFSLQEMIELMKPLCSSLDYAHKNGIVHRDIKPANIMIDKSGKPFLADFGVARIETSTMTQAGTTVGTLSYMSPEQIQGLTVDGRSDIFALGVILYELLSGKKPFFGDNISTIVYKIVHEEPQRITEVNQDLPRGYELVIKKALAKSPEDRYPTCQELVADLENAGKILEQTLAYETEKKASAPARAKRKLGFVLALALGGVVVAAGGAYLLFLPKSEKTSRLSQNLETLKKEGISPVTRSGGTGPGAAALTDENLAKLKESFENKNYEETIKLAEDILAAQPANQAAQDYLKKALREILAVQVAPLIQSGISSYNSGNYGQCVQDMEKVLKLDAENKEGQKYLFLADTAVSKKDILGLIERQRVAEENKDLVTVLSHVGSPALASQMQSEYKLLFNAYDGIKSSVSNISVNFSGRSEARASFSHLLTAVYKKDGKRKIVFEGAKNWHFKKQGKNWKLEGSR